MVDEFSIKINRTDRERQGISRCISPTQEQYVCRNAQFGEPLESLKIIDFISYPESPCERVVLVKIYKHLNYKFSICSPISLFSQKGKEFRTFRVYKAISLPRSREHPT